MWPFKKKIKPPAPKVEVWLVPYDKVLEFTELYDAMLANFNQRVPEVKFWWLVKRIAPDDLYGSCRVQICWPNHRPALEFTHPVK